MRRREFITLIGGAAAASATIPFAAHAQQSDRPVVAYVSSFPRDTSQKLIESFRQGLSETGFVDGRNVTVEYRFAEGGQYNKLPGIMEELVRQRAAVLFVSPIPAAMAAKKATSTTPIVFVIGSDPVEMGLAESMQRPGRNATGATFLSVELGAKRLELLRALVPKVAIVGFLRNPNNPNAARQTEELQAATSALGTRFDVVDARSERDLENAFATLTREHADALIVSPDPMFLANRQQLVGLASQRAIPTMYFAQQFAVAGGLISYATSFAGQFRDAAHYVGRILKGEKPGDLPVLQPTKFELVINLKAAKALALNVPVSLLSIADEVIE